MSQGSSTRGTRFHSNLEALPRVDHVGRYFPWTASSPYSNTYVWLRRDLDEGAATASGRHSKPKNQRVEICPQKSQVVRYFCPPSSIRCQNIENQARITIRPPHHVVDARKSERGRWSLNLVRMTKTTMTEACRRPSCWRLKRRCRYFNATVAVLR